MSDENTTDKAIFEASDPGEYTGPERRIRQRRVLTDRREMIRFEPEKNPRRSGKDRRKAKSVWDDRETF